MSFQDSLMKVFQQLGTLSPDFGSSLKPLPGSVGPLITTAAPVLRTAKTNGSGSDQPPQSAKVVRSGTTLDRREFLKLLECLCDEFPKNLQHRTLSALQQNQYQQQNRPLQQSSLNSTTVSFTEFQRGVEVCLLLEGSYWTFVYK